MLKKSLSMVSLCIIASGCGGTPSSVQPQNPYSDVSSYFDPYLSEANKSEIAPLLRLLPTEWRDTVLLVDLARNSMYSNRIDTPPVAFVPPGNQLVTASLKGSLSSQALSPQVCTGGALFRDNYGAPKKGSGVFYRVLTDAGTFDRLKNRAWLPPEANIYDFESNSQFGNDTAYMYMGGFGDQGQPLEIGLKHNTLNGSRGGNWSPYIATSAGRAVIRIDLPERGNKKYYFDSNTKVFMELVLVGEKTPNNYAVFVTTGTYRNSPVQYVIATPLTSANGLYDWQLPITNLRFYRTTSIAQTNVAPGKEFSANFSYFKGAKWDLGAYGRTLGSTSAPTQVWKKGIGCIVGKENREVFVTRPLGNTVEEETISLNTNWTGPLSLPQSQEILVR